MSKNPLSKNFVYKDKPRNELEGLLANMHGENYPVEAKNGLIKEASKLTPGSGSALPAVTSADNGKVLGVVDGEWATEDKRFVVTCTPTAQDYSGTMDKTPAEIEAAWTSGKSIWFKIVLAGAEFWLPMSVRDSGSYCSAYVIYPALNALIRLTTSANSKKYSTNIYQLTPLGS